ncbi:hypothetical protein B0O99DRAFT_590131 [Bisporella sp. PMI_857]|nr:hypothetical protein B0O99DRAFT_590131 [Bisporella sp. PMI_857]
MMKHFGVKEAGFPGARTEGETAALTNYGETDKDWSFLPQAIIDEADDDISSSSEPTPKLKKARRTLKRTLKEERQNEETDKYGKKTIQGKKTLSLLFQYTRKQHSTGAWLRLLGYPCVGSAYFRGRPSSPGGFCLR